MNEPTPPLMRYMREGYGHHCPKCGSTSGCIGGFIFWGIEYKCHHPECGHVHDGAKIK